MDVCYHEFELHSQLVVRNTFLEYVCEASRDGKRRSKSVPAELTHPYRSLEKSRPSSASSASTEIGTDSEESSEIMVERPRYSVDTCSETAESEPEWRTTVMLRNLPNNYTRDMLLQHIDAMGFCGLYDFFYMPIDFNSKASMGYAFVNLICPEYAQNFMTSFEGFFEWVIPTRKRCIVNWSNPHQGLESNVERYRNSPVMHKDVPDSFKPALFVNGIRVNFPEATKRLRCPRLRALTGNGQNGKKAIR
jgi:RNA recognition motif-containing protein